jgi:glycosyltransferase involved in cell wall biosynthesis
MKITIDLRSLSSGTVSGVENYCLNMVENLLVLDKKNQYTLFYNGFFKGDLPDFHYINSRTKISRWPNKLLNVGLKTGRINFEKLTGQPDWLFMPNLNQFNIGPNTKLAITVHDLSPVVTPEFYDLKRRVWHKFLNYKKAFNRADLLFAVSEYTKNDLIKIFGINPDKIKVVYPGIDHNVFKTGISVNDQRLVRNIYGLPGEYVLFLGTIEPRKNLSTLIKAFERIKHKASLVIAGRPGWKYRSDFKLIQRSVKFAKIKYVGYVSEEHKPGLIKLASVLIYPSFYEGFGFQALEAMALGTPVIASQVTSLPEVVGNSGLLINPYEVASLAQAMDMVLTENKFTDNLVNRGFEQASKFNWRASASQTLSYMQS